MIFVGLFKIAREIRNQTLFNWIGFIDQIIIFFFLIQTDTLFAVAFYKRKYLFVDRQNTLPVEHYRIFQIVKVTGVHRRTPEFHSDTLDKTEFLYRVIACMISIEELSWLIYSYWSEYFCNK